MERWEREAEAEEKANEAKMAKVRLRQRVGAELPPAFPRPGQVWVDPVDGMVMVYVPVGRFIFGMPADAEPGLSDPPTPRKDQRETSLEAFWIGKSLVTNTQYKRLVIATGIKEPDGWHVTHAPYPGDIALQRDPPWADLARRPARVTWLEAGTYCRWTGKELPSEEQWEKAARGTDGRRYPWGSQWLPELGDGDTRPTIGPSSVDVGPYGCRDMLFWLQWTSAYTPPTTKDPEADDRYGRTVEKGYWGPGYPLAQMPGRYMKEAGLCRRVTANPYCFAAFRCVLRAKR